MKKYNLFIVVMLIGFSGLAQKIKPKKGYTPQIGIMIDMLENLKGRITKRVKNMSVDQIIVMRNRYQFSLNTGCFNYTFIHIFVL